MVSFQQVLRQLCLQTGRRMVPTELLMGCWGGSTRGLGLPSQDPIPGWAWWDTPGQSRLPSQSLLCEWLGEVMHLV